MSNVALQDVYANNLQQNRGYPLRRPNFSTHPEGLRIGDIGYVDEFGAFHVHCNIRFPSRSELDQFQAIQLDEDLICKDATAVLVEHSFFTGVKQRATTQESGIYEFAATAERGAILILPSGATLHDLQDQQTLDEFQELAIKHAHRWCLSARRNSLYLITGLYQTSSWTLASFHGRRDVNGEKVFVQRSVDHLPVYQWKPEFPNLDSQSCHNNTQFEKQTVLIKGFKMTVRPKLGVTIVGPIQGWRNCFELLIECLKCLASQFGVIIPPIGTSIKFDPELYRQPHHLDAVNNYLLETSKADVVISHDDVWIKLLEKSKSMVIQEDELLEHVKGEYNTRSRNNAIWLERRLEDPNGVLAQETESSKPRVVITHICAENVTVGLGYVPVGFFVRIEIDGDISRSTENKPALVDDHNIQWDDRIYLPSASSTKVRLVLCASFEFSPMLGSGEPIGTLEIRVSDLLERTRPFTIKESRMSRSISLLVSARPWYGKNWMSSRVDDNDRKEHSTLPNVIDLTDEGHHALLGYYRNYNERDLESSVTSFTQALNKCPKDNPLRVAALSNLAKAQFLSDQFHGAHDNYHESTSMFKEALRLRAGDHRDRPMTLLYLSQALLYYHASGLQVPQSTLHEYINELETICPRDTHARHAADVVLQTYGLIQLKISDDLKKLNELIPKWVRAANEVPEGYFDKPVRFDNIGLALQRRFQLCYNTIDLKKAIEWFEKAVQITPDGHAQKSTYEDHLSDARLYQWAMMVLTGSSVNKALDAAVKEFNDVPKSHIYRVICDVLEGSNRVLEAIECFCKMHTPNERTWEVDIRRRCVKKLEEQGDTLMESRDLNTAIECYSIALSLDSTNISDIIVKCCKARVGLLEEQRLINANKGGDRISGVFSTAPRTNDLVLYVFAVDFSLSSKSSKNAEIESIELWKYQSVATRIRKTIRAGESHREEFSRPITIDPSDKFRASVKLRRAKWLGSAEDVPIALNLHEVECTSNERDERLYRFEATKGIVVEVSALREFSAVTNRVMPTNSESQFRVLVIGNSGVGKSSLINKVFGINDVQVSATTRGDADIERGLPSKDKRFVIHDTLGFEAGDEGNVQIVEEFVEKRKKMPENDRLHAVWLCIEIPYAGGQLFESGTQKFLRHRKNILGDIPLVVVLTKVDLLDAQLLVDQPRGMTVERFKSENMNEHFIKPLRKAGGLDLKYVTVSRDDCAEDLYQLLDATVCNHRNWTAT